MSREFLPNPFAPQNYPHCDNIERGLCHVIDENGEYKLKEKFDLKHLEIYDKLFAMSQKEQLTVIIPTSPIPSHPSTAIIDETIANIRKYTDARIIIMADGVHESLEHRRADYEAYIASIWQKYDNTTVISHPHHMHQAEMTRHALIKIKTPLVMFCEHDTSPIGDIPFQQICDMVEHSRITNCVRFNIFDRIPEEHQYLMIREYEDGGIPLTATIQYSQRPHIAKTEWYRGILRDHFEPGRKTMIEDVMHSVVQVHMEINFGLAIYTPEGNQLRSYHSDGRGSDVKIIEG